MSGYGYGYSGGYSSPYNGGAPQKDEWSKASYPPDNHVCRPVVVDAEGKKRPIVAYGPNHHKTEGYVRKTETIIENVHSPAVTDYRHSPPTKVYPVKDYGAVEERRQWTSSSIHDRPREVEEFITQVQTDGSKGPNKFGKPGATQWTQNHNSTGEHGKHGHGEYNSTGNYRPSGNTIRNDNYDDDDRNYYHQNDSRMKPSMTTTGGWARPSHATWSSPPAAPLSKPTNNIDAAVEYLKDAAKPPSSSSTSAPHSRYSEPHYSGAIDSNEAARRYGNYNLSSRSYSADDPNKSTIDSREAMRKYNGTLV